MKSFRAISHISVDLVSVVSGTVYVISLGVDVMSVVFVRYAFYTKWLPFQPGPRAELLVKSAGCTRDILHLPPFAITFTFRPLYIIEDLFAP
jgi:hypothetical protein